MPPVFGKEKDLEADLLLTWEISFFYKNNSKGSGLNRL